MRFSSTARCGSCAWPKGFGHGYPPSERPAGPIACSSCRRARLHGPERKPVTNSSRRSRPTTDGARARGPGRPAGAALRRMRRAWQLVLRRLPRPVRANRARGSARPSGGGRASRPAPPGDPPAEIPKRAGARGGRGRRGQDRRDALGRRRRGAIGRCPRGAGVRRGDRRMSRSRWLVRGLLLFVLAFANLNDIRSDTSQGGEAPGLWSPDVLPNALFAWTVIKEHNVNYDEFTVPGGTRAPATTLDREAYFFRACGESTATAPPNAKRSPGGPPAPGPNDHVCSVFPPGMGILALPFFAPFVLTGAYPLDLGLLVHGGHVVAAIVEILATLILWSVLRRFATPRWSLMLVLLYFLATRGRTVARQALWQHSRVHPAVASALWLTLREEPIPLSRDLAAGVVLGLGGVLRQTTALVALA